MVICVLLWVGSVGGTSFAFTSSFVCPGLSQALEVDWRRGGPFAVPHWIVITQGGIYHWSGSQICYLRVFHFPTSVSAPSQRRCSNTYYFLNWNYWVTFARCGWSSNAGCETYRACDESSGTISPHIFKWCWNKSVPTGSREMTSPPVCLIPWCNVTVRFQKVLVSSGWQRSSLSLFAVFPVLWWLNVDQNIREESGS